MARIVKRTWHEPHKLSLGGEDKDKLYRYDADGKRHECPDSLPGIRALLDELTIADSAMRYEEFYGYGAERP